MSAVVLPYYADPTYCTLLGDGCLGMHINLIMDSLGQMHEIQVLGNAPSVPLRTL